MRRNYLVFDDSFLGRSSAGFNIELKIGEVDPSISLRKMPSNPG